MAFSTTAARSTRWRERHPERVVARNFRQNLQRKGLTLDEYEALLARQGGLCAICDADEPGGRGRFHVDHDHDSGEIRGLLCHACNVGLGNLGDDPKRLRAAAAYLEGG